VLLRIRRLKVNKALKQNTINRERTPCMKSKNLSRPRTTIKAQRKCTTSTVVKENPKLKLYKSSRQVSLKHLNRLCEDESNYMLMQVFCKLLNALKKPEFRLQNSVFEDWESMTAYLTNHNRTILAEIIAVANKIERELYEANAIESLLDLIKEVQIPEKCDNSYKSIYGFID
jgi:hypothetical protein